MVAGEGLEPTKPTDYDSVALPIELTSHCENLLVSALGFEPRTTAM